MTQEDRTGKAQSSSRASGHVQSLSRALSLLNALSEHSQGLSLSAVAHEVGLPTSTAHRLLTTLQNERYVRFDADHSAWLVGVQAFRAGSAFLRSRDLVTTSRPYMRRLMEQCGETVNLAVLDRGEVIYLAQTETHKMMRAIAKPGGRAEIFSSGVGKALLAFMPEGETDQLLQRISFYQETENTLANVRDLQRDLEAIKLRGYAVDDEENAIGLRCVAGVIFDENANPMAGLSVSGPAARVTEARIPVLGAAVSQIASEITAAIGGQTLARESA
ncbi:MAG: helix-turn-helix domain-containing protein [Alphaproteobacteria bacterium]|nr:helix-turn-helix domain-containing protein [Alphaproteobacteria bacterium]